MNLQRILFPTAFSEFDDAALSYASTLAAESGATLYIVHVDERYDLSAALVEGAYAYPLAYDDDRRKIGEQLSRVLPRNDRVRYEHHYLQGGAVAEIVKFANRERCDLIVMASHGRTGLARLAMGSVAEGVMRRAHCPVLVVKTSTAATQPADDVRSHVLQE